MRQLSLLCLVAAACSPPPPLAVGEHAAALTYPWNGLNGGSPDYVASPDTGIADHGGPVISSTTRIQFIFYGDVPVARQHLFESFIRGLDGSPQAGVLTSYRDVNGARPNAQLVLAPSILEPINFWVGYNQINDEDGFHNLISIALGETGQPLDGNTIYVVITDANTGASFDGNDFCDGAAGWHGSFDEMPIFAFVGDPAYCGTVPTGASPNDDPGGDDMVSKIWHEIAEAITDPQPSFNMGFYAVNAESADLCASDFVNGAGWSPVGYAQPDESYLVTNKEGQQAAANIHLGGNLTGEDFLIQPLWQNLVGGGGCARRLVANRPSVSSNPSRPVGDLDGDGTADLLFHGVARSNVARSLVTAGPTVAGEQVFGTVTDNMNLYAVADFDNNPNGRSDLLWRDQNSGAISVWANGVIHQLTPSSLDDWVIRGVGDFDGNHCADILFQNMPTNQTHIWLNDCSLAPWTVEIGNDAWATDLQPPSYQNTDTVGVGDFDGDGRADILWHTIAVTHSDTHSYDWWKMSGRHAVSHTIPSRSFDFVLGLADVRGSGQAEIVAVSGSNVVWVNTLGAATVIGSRPLNVWRYAGSSTIAATGGPKGILLFQNRTSGEIERWLLDRSTGWWDSTQVLVSSHDLSDELVAF